MPTGVMQARPDRLRGNLLVLSISLFKRAALIQCLEPDRRVVMEPLTYEVR